MGNTNSAGEPPAMPTEEEGLGDLEDDDGLPDEPEMDMDEVMNAAKTDALEDDWACMKEPPWGNDKMPGLRYGASIEIRPLTVVLPCPCAGGTWNAPHEDDGARLDWTGLWHEPSEGHGTIAGLPKPKLTMMAHPPEVEVHHREDLLEDLEAAMEGQAGHPIDLEHQGTGGPRGGHLIVRDEADTIEDHEKKDFSIESAQEAIEHDMKHETPEKVETSELEISHSSDGAGNALRTAELELSKASRPHSRHHDILVAAAARKRKLTAKTPRAVKQSASAAWDLLARPKRPSHHVRGQSHQHHLFPHHRRRPSSRNVIASINVAPEGQPPTMSSFMISGDAMEKYYPGSEPYAIDFGCAKGNSRGVLDRKWKPGMRWKDVPGWTALVVPTPCPCALGVFTRVQPPPVNHLPPTPDSLFVDPDLGGLSNANAAPWQGPNSTKLGSMAFGAVIMALLGVRAGPHAPPGCARQGCKAEAAGQPRRRPVSKGRAAQDFGRFL